MRRRTRPPAAAAWVVVEAMAQSLAHSLSSVSVPPSWTAKGASGNGAGPKPRPIPIPRPRPSPTQQKRRRGTGRRPGRPSSTMPPLAAADAFLVLEFVAGNRRVPHPVFAGLLAALPSVSPHTSPRLRKAFALRALDLALSGSDADDSGELLCKARDVLANPELASCFPDHLVVCDDVAALRRLVDVEWANLPPSAVELEADRIAGAGALDTWANADQDKRKKLRLLVDESTEREILGKLGQDPSKAPQVDEAANAPSTSGVNEANGAQQDDEAHLGREHGKASHAQEDCAQHQQEPVERTTDARHQQEPVERTTDARLPDKPVTSAAIKGKDQATSSGVTGQVAPDINKSHPVAGSKPSLMERKPNAIVYEWDDSGDSDSERPPHQRRLPTYERKMRPPPAVPHKTRKKWTEIQERTLIEGVDKYGKGNWKDIKIAYPDVFQDRSTVDMKDKFRNMGRH